MTIQRSTMKPVAVLALAAFLLGSLPVSSETTPPIPITPEIEACMRQVLGDARVTAILGGATMTPEENAQLGVCFPAQTPPSIPPETKACMGQILGEARTTAILSGSEPTAEEKAKLESCFTGQGPSINGAPPIDMTPELRECLLAAVGEARFTAIGQGQGQPTDEEMQKGLACFNKLGIKPPSIDTSRVIPPAIAQCMALALGQERFLAISTGKAVPSLDDRRAAESCFGATPGPMSEGIKPQMSPRVFECLKNAVGEDRFREISSGQSVPTETEQAAGEKCFSKFNRSQSTESVLPPPTKQVPFLDERETSVSITGVTATEKNGVDIVIIKGRGPKKAVVDVHLQEKNLSFTVQTNWKGTWSYTLKRKLAEGEYDFYATTRYSKQTVRSEVEEVEVN